MNITKLDATLEDGSVVTIFPVSTPTAPMVTEVDVKESDGSEQTLVPPTATA